VADHGYWTSAGSRVVFRQQSASDLRFHAERREVVARDHLTREQDRITMPAQGKPDRAIKKQRRKNRILVPVIFVIGIGAEQVARISPILCIHTGQSGGITDGQGSQENRIYESKDSGVGPDT